MKKKFILIFCLIFAMSAALFAIQKGGAGNTNGEVLVGDGAGLTNIIATTVPSNVAKTDQSNTFNSSQTINGNFASTGTITASGDVKATSGRVYDKTGGQIVPAGSIMAYAGSSAPTGWLLCDGLTVTSSSNYPDLWAALGGSGGTTKTVPNLRGRVPVGYDVSVSSFDVLGETGGEREHTLSIAEMPSHNHYTETPKWTNPLPAGSRFYADSNGPYGSVNSYSSSTGSGTSHNNLQPYIVVNYIIKY